MESLLSLNKFLFKSTLSRQGECGIICPRTGQIKDYMHEKQLFAVYIYGSSVGTPFSKLENLEIKLLRKSHATR